MSYRDLCEIKELVGKTLIAVTNQGDERIVFETNNETFTMYHEQDCCENVRVEEIIGDLKDLVESPILHAEEVSSTATEVSESGTWTFYKIATIKGSVTIRWLGESNGYYSESVYFCRVFHGN